jgi:protein-disulfide isomerase
MSDSHDEELFVVKKWHLYVAVTAVISFIAGMTVRSLLLGPLPYAVISSGASMASPSTAPSTSLGAVSPAPTPSGVEVSADDDPAVGPIDAPVLIVEFTDYQCSYCASFARETLRQILDNYGDQVRFVVRDFPILSMHPQAQKAAQAAQCANDQGRFWEYHDLLFQNQQALDASSLEDYAQQLDLEVAAFTTCLDSDRYLAEVQHDLTDGQSYGVNGTPTFFINGRLLRGAQPFSAFQEMIDEELQP